MARLTADQVEDVRRRVGAGESRVDVAASLGISRFTVDSIMTGRRGGPTRRAGALSGEQVSTIRALADLGMSQTAIAREVGTSQQMVSKVLRG